jgi:hypothetical protein
MNILTKGNIFAQIKQYFTKSQPNAENTGKEEEKEKVKL